MRYEIVTLVNGELFMFATFKKAEAENKYQEWCDLYGQENVSMEKN
ncbi:hypothetical protein BT3_019 [Staphylococcus phage BT3]|uniref:Uncharacterized protein n=4 Tax=Kayvirus TaxID=1857843 RepID=V5XUJ4_BPS25|nr:hypothetical protein X577_gp167 [Staphylococcus phage S25-4]YP_008854147.1 hypothetical protein X600_gp194 [Staphylococcus phage S25-3]AXU40181.1 hypothetical protein VBSavMJYL01_179 [Staphylococcus phage VB_SavM_JYL01]AZU97587.1 hypothetical protein VBSavMJYL02_175 [Staphylococcus phage VB-SavM-JYL02]QVD57980.1 hypothetical protein BT3_019 [Staphylococcus phage BT3]WBF04127.1 hypothetical protein VL14_ORF182 [Staphylococcus phage vB_SauM_VL14]BAO09175.1 hypothetical protein [Staphylococcu